VGRYRTALVFLFVFTTGTIFAQPERPIRRPANNELALETIEAPPHVDAPDAVQGLTARLVFHVSPLSGKGLLSQQVRDALKALDKANGDSTFIKLRAFVAGTGDQRRIQSIVTEEFAAKKWPLPAITTVLVGALPMENAQVVIESISEEKKNSVNPAGLVFVSAQPSVAQLEKAMQAAGAVPVRVSCFADSLAGAEAARAAAAKAFPTAAGSFVQTTRAGIGNRVSCEGVGRLRAAAAGVSPIERTPDAVLVRVPKLVFSGAQMAFVEQDSGVQQVYDRLGRAIKAVGGGEVLVTNRYSVAGFAARSEASLVIEGLPALEANLAVEVVAAVN